MKNNPSLGIRFNESDKQALREVARRLCNGNQTQTLRMLVRTTLEVLRENDQKAGKTDTEKKPLQGSA